MKFRLTIRCDSEAFTDPRDDKIGGECDQYQLRQEVARILDVAARRVAVHGETSATLHDLYGLDVGTFYFTED